MVDLNSSEIKTKKKSHLYPLELITIHEKALWNLMTHLDKICFTYKKISIYIDMSSLLF